MQVISFQLLAHKNTSLHMLITYVCTVSITSYQQSFHHQKAPPSNATSKEKPRHGLSLLVLYVLKPKWKKICQFYFYLSVLAPSFLLLQPEVVIFEKHKIWVINVQIPQPVFSWLHQRVDFFSTMNATLGPVNTLELVNSKSKDL